MRQSLSGELTQEESSANHTSPTELFKIRANMVQQSNNRMPRLNMVAIKAEKMQAPINLNSKQEMMVSGKTAFHAIPNKQASFKVKHLAPIVDHEQQPVKK